MKQKFGATPHDQFAVLVLISGEMLIGKSRIRGSKRNIRWEELKSDGNANFVTHTLTAACCKISEPKMAVQPTGMYIYLRIIIFPSHLHRYPSVNRPANYDGDTLPRVPHDIGRMGESMSPLFP